MPYVIENVGTGSPVSHTISSLGVVPYDMVWEDKKRAARHAYNLTQEYALTRPELEPVYRTWRIKPATPEQVERAKFVAAFGEDWEDAIGAGPVSDARGKAGVRDPRKGFENEIQAFRDSLDPDRKL